MRNFIIARTADDNQVRVPADDVTSYATNVAPNPALTADAGVAPVSAKRDASGPAFGPGGRR